MFPILGIENVLKAVRPPTRQRLRIGVLIVALLSGCQGPQATTKADAPDQLLWPAPPERPRFAYEFTLRAPADIAGDSQDNGVLQALTGARPSQTPAFSKPAGIAARNGRIYVTDTANHLVAVFDVPRRRVFHFGARTPGTLSKPVAIATDAAGRVYVADATRREVLVYDALGLLLTVLGGPRDLVRPVGIAVDGKGSRVYVVDRGGADDSHHRVVAFDAQGSKLFEIGRRGDAAGEFNVPVQAAISSDGTLFVLDAGNFRVQAFDANGRYLHGFGKVGAGPGNFARPRGLAIDGEDHIYVSDASFGNFQIFDARGQLLLAIGEAGVADRPGKFRLLAGIATDETGRVYVADQLFGKVEVYRPLSAAEADSLITHNRK